MSEHRMRIRWTVALVLLFLVTAAAWAQAPRPKGTMSVDDEFTFMAAKIPGFGGIFFDEVEGPTMHLIDAGQPGIFQGFLRDFRILPAQYDWLQLMSWRATARELLAAPGVVMLDVDEARNRVRIGFETGSDESVTDNLIAELERLGIPQEAVVLEEADPILEVSHDLTHAFNPVPAGVEINFSNFLCTLGVNAKAGSACFFLTNDHCTDVQGSVTGTTYFQPFGGPFIGTEIADPAFFTGGVCPAGRRCRYSDAAMAEYADPDDCEHGSIARTFFSSTAVDPANPRWTIVRKQRSPLVGQVMAKEGRTTGWTEGPVVATCVDSNVAGSNITRLCQSFVAAGVGSGDSGSPVFRRRLQSSRASFAGLLWGSNGAGTQFVFSPVRNIEFDLGVTLDVF